MPIIINVPEPKQAYGPIIRDNPWTYYAYDFLTGNLIGQVPLRGVSFGQQLNTAGQLTGYLDLWDPRVQATFPIACTVPGRTFIVADFEGGIQWGGIVMPRKWDVPTATTSTTRQLEVQCSELWAYFAQRVQATDYSSPPHSGITGTGSTMALWNPPGGIGGPWDASLIACQIIEDAIGYANSKTVPYGNPLGELGILLNGATPSLAHPAAPEADWIAVNYPFTSLQMVDTIVSQLAQLGLGVGFDYGVDVAYTSGAGTAPIATVNISYPRRGRTVAENFKMIDLTTARDYMFPEDGTQLANQVYEVGGGGALSVSVNPFPQEQGYPLWERVISRSNIQSAGITHLLKQLGFSDLALYSYPLVAPTVTLGTQDINLPLGSFTVGDDVRLVLPALDADGQVFDPRFPAGLDQEWRITAWKADIKDEGDATYTLTLAQPPALEALAPDV